jgi:putative inorganic carbon (HCO3(-)) transporter
MSYLLLFVTVAISIRQRHQLDRVILVTSLSATAVSLYSIVQWSGIDPLASVWGPPDGRLGAFSTLGAPAFVGAYLALCVPLALAKAFSDTSGSAARAGLWSFVLATQIVALVLCQSRAAWVGATIGAIIVLLALARTREFRRVSGLAICATTVLTASGLGVLILSGRVQSDALIGRLVGIARPAEGTLGERFAVWRVALRLIQDRPVFGFGPDTFGTTIAYHYSPELHYLENTYFLVDRVHQATLETLVNVGFVGALSFALLGFVFTAAVLGVLRRGTTDLVAISLCAGLVAHLVEQQFNLEVIAASVPAWIIAGAIVGRAHEQGVGLTESRLTAILAPLNRTNAVRRMQPLVVVVAASAFAFVIWWAAAAARADVAYGAALAAEHVMDQPAAVANLTDAVSIWPYEPVYWNDLGRVQFGTAKLLDSAPGFDNGERPTSMLRYGPPVRMISG